jgi:acetoin utilization deacetylase AcuC-like enzyme
MTGIVYEEAYLTHGDPHHPENAQRLAAAVGHLRDTGLWDEMKHVPARPAEVQEISWVHDEDYVEEVEAVSRAGGGSLDPDTQATAETYDVARLAAGGCVAAMEAVLLREIDNAMCLVRPPGHHALPGRGMGFCFFNNIAIAAEVAVRRGHRDRVSIVDWDVHHGNGTQEYYYARGDVQYISLHQGMFYPGTGSIDEVGLDPGAGTTVNIPLPPGAEDHHYAQAFEELVVPLVGAFGAEAILVSCGFDTHFADPLASMCLTSAAYYRMTEMLVDLAADLCEGTLLLVLEGGYDKGAMARGTEAVCRALMGLDEPEPETLPYRVHPSVTQEVERWLEHAIDTHRKRLGG